MVSPSSRARVPRPSPGYRAFQWSRSARGVVGYRLLRDVQLDLSGLFLTAGVGVLLLSGHHRYVTRMLAADENRTKWCPTELDARSATPDEIRVHSGSIGRTPHNIHVDSAPIDGAGCRVHSHLLCWRHESPVNAAGNSPRPRRTLGDPATRTSGIGVPHTDLY